MSFFESKFSFHAIVDDFCSELEKNTKQQNMHIGGMVKTHNHHLNLDKCAISISCFKHFVMHNTQQMDVLICLKDEVKELLAHVFQYFDNDKVVKDLYDFYISKCKKTEKKNGIEYVNIMLRSLCFKDIDLHYPQNQIYVNEYLYKFCHDRNIFFENSLMLYKYDHFLCMLNNNNVDTALDVMNKLKSDVLLVFGLRDTFENDLLINFIFKNNYDVIAQGHCLDILSILIYKYKDCVSLKCIQDKVYSIFNLQNTSKEIVVFYRKTFCVILKKFDILCVGQKSCSKKTYESIQRHHSLDLSNFGDNMPFKLISSPKKTILKNPISILEFSPLRRRLNMIKKSDSNKKDDTYS